MKSRINKETLLEKASTYLELKNHSDQKVEAFRMVFNHEIEVAFKERRMKDWDELQKLYHNIVMSVPV